MSPRTVDKEKKVKEIAKAAIKLFSQKGYTATSVEQIAKAAGIAKSTIYEYFETKEDIFVATSIEWMAQVEIQLFALLEEIKDPIHRLHAIIEMGMELFDPENPNTAWLLFEIMQQTLLENRAFFKRRYLVQEMTAHFAQIRRIVMDILLDGISQGIFRSGIARDAEKIAINLLYYLEGIGLHSMISENHLDLKGQIDFYLQSLIHAISNKPEEGNEH